MAKSPSTKHGFLNQWYDQASSTGGAFFDAIGMGELGDAITEVGDKVHTKLGGEVIRGQKGSVSRTLGLAGDEDIINNDVVENSKLGIAGQDEAAAGTAGGQVDPSTGQYVGPSAAVNSPALASVNNKSLTPISQGSATKSPMQVNTNIPLHLQTNSQIS